MLSSSMMSILIAFYVVIAVVSAVEGNFWRSAYWVAASVLTLSILKTT